MHKELLCSFIEARVYQGCRCKVVQENILSVNLIAEASLKIYVHFCNTFLKEKFIQPTQVNFVFCAPLLTLFIAAFMSELLIFFTYDN